MKKSLRRSACCSLLLSAVAGGLAGCSTAPASPEAQQELASAATKALDQMKSDDPTLQPFLSAAYAYVIFPKVGQGAAGVGVANGQGEAYAGDKLVGYAELDLVNVGAEVGAGEFSELLVFKNKDAFDKFTNNPVTLEAGVSAVILKSGAAGEAKWSKDVVVFKRPKAGAMVEAAVGGQRFTYKAAPPAP